MCMKIRHEWGGRKWELTKSGRGPLASFMHFGQMHDRGACRFFSHWAIAVGLTYLCRRIGNSGVSLVRCRCVNVNDRSRMLALPSTCGSPPLCWWCGLSVLCERRRAVRESSRVAGKLRTAPGVTDGMLSGVSVVAALAGEPAMVVALWYVWNRWCACIGGSVLAGREPPCDEMFSAGGTENVPVEPLDALELAEWTPWLIIGRSGVCSGLSGVCSGLASSIRPCMPVSSSSRYCVRAGTVIACRWLSCGASSALTGTELDGSSSIITSADTSCDGCDVDDVKNWMLVR
ncbi:hypothetical protein DL89DRAFT_50466 [Linderina pennispora]|uniref:Uncharacterized protein n=1 Tax=Linderina pennispora TaxID=61395 RepID=A0A1Y1VS16_9FUNG|nr:uncharacterized protein DL89DRAFT_50466 [Linderina pennispora]ORX64081.1 hypothetical protein DL89DRAFT_50466 [Linderina pennispora]